MLRELDVSCRDVVGHGKARDIVLYVPLGDSPCLAPDDDAKFDFIIELFGFWNMSFVFGSFAAAFIQGLTVGALVEGLPIANGEYTGGDFGWFSPFAVLCGLGLCLGYALLGACWLVKKCEADVRAAAYRLIPPLAVGLLILLVVVFVYSLAENLQVMGRWMERPYLFVFPVTAALAAVVLALSVRYRRDDLPFPMVVLIFVSAFGALAISFWPYMIPFVLTINEAAAPQ